VSKKTTKNKQNDEIKRKLFDYFASSYFYYKVCEGCEFVVLQDRIFCPFCDSYNFDSSYKRISTRVNEIVDKDTEVFVNFINSLEEYTY